MKTLAILALAAIAQPAFGDEPTSVGGECVAVICDSRTKHPMEQFPCGTPACACWDNCDGSSASASNQNSKAMAEGMAKLLAYTFLGVAFVFMPGHIGELTSKDKPRQTAKQAHEAWDTYVAKRNQLIAAGRTARQSRHALWQLDQEERARLRDAPTSKRVKVPVPFNPPKLKPDLGFSCNQARLLMTTVHTSGPFGAFASEDEMVTKCKPFYDEFKEPDPTCAPDQSYRCGANPAVCCPRSHPILNPCDGMCYRSFDYRASPKHECIHSSEAPHCNTVTP